jgi:transposase InsO family protein
VILLVQLYSHYSVGYYCKLFGKSRQAFYGQNNNDNDKGLQHVLALKLVAEVRKDLPRCGTDKLHYMLKQRFNEHRIKLGRDGLYDLLGRYGLLIRHRNRRPYTTNSQHHYKKYPNLIRAKTMTHAGQLWVSDITYIRQHSCFSYLSIITDAYSHKIVGYKLHPTLHSEGAVDALVMAAADTKKTDAIIHHSDRGIQYCCSEYVRMAEHFGIQLSMTEKGDPYENAIAERVNGILKHEHGLKENFGSYNQAKAAVDDAVKKYNELRIHDSCNRLTPVMAHEQKGILKKYWKPKVYGQKSCQLKSVIAAKV